MKYLSILLIISVLVLSACSTSQPVPVVGEAVEQPTAAATITIPESDEMVQNEPVVLQDSLNLVANTENSEVVWQASRIAQPNPYRGTVTLQSGELIRENGEFTSGTFVLDMTSIAHSNSRLVGHLQSDDFFSVDMYPTSTFEITEMAENSDGTYTVTGDLTIKDITNPVTFTAELVQGGSDVLMNAAFEIDRTQWGITYDSGSVFSDLGDRAIRDEIRYELSLVLN